MGDISLEEAESISLEYGKALLSNVIPGVHVRLEKSLNLKRLLMYPFYNFSHVVTNYPSGYTSSSGFYTLGLNR